MKKVLALVLAVIMVCTMAMAVTISAATTVVVLPSTSANKPATLSLNTAGFDKEGNFYVAMPEDLFVELANLAGKTYTTTDITEKNFEVTVSSSPAVKVVYSKTGGAYLQIAKIDKPIDEKADIIVSSVKVVMKNAGTTVCTLGADKDGNFEYKSIVVKGNTMKAADLETINTAVAALKVATTYDVGFTPFEVADVATGATYATGAWGWNVNYEDNATVLAIGDNSANGATIVGTVKLAKGAEVKLAEADAAKWSDLKTNVNKAIAKAAKNPAAVGTYYGGVSATLAADFVIAGGDDVYVYTVNADGTVSPSAFKFADGKGWTMSGKEMPLTVVSPVKLATVAGTTTTETGTTTNPGTGANDVVGVAAALAVVALVSGAAISLKK